jgi:hypothetical protein
MLYDVLWCCALFCAYLCGLGVRRLYVLRPQRARSAYRSQLPTLTGLEVHRATVENADRCRPDR